MHGNNTYAQNTTFIINNPVMCLQDYFTVQYFEPDPSF